MMARRLVPCLVLFVLSGAAATASVVGTNPPAQSLTKERIAQLPAAKQRAWLDYLARSERQRQADKQAMKIETRQAGLDTPLVRPEDASARSIPLYRDPAWYRTGEARHIADVIVSFQTPAGGWGKNIAMNKEPRRPGEAYTSDNLSKFLGPDDYDRPREPDWNYVGTIDNDATTTELQFLAKTIGAFAPGDASEYRQAFVRGMNYLLAAQFPNGGWPQVWPLEGGYHDAITYNDDAVVNVIELMRHAAGGAGEYGFVPPDVRQRAAQSFARGIECVMATQIRTGGKRTVWAQQNDALTLEPVSARNYEPPAQSSGESARILLMLMNELPHPTAGQQQAIRAAAAWLRKTAIYGQAWKPTPEGRRLVSTPGAGPIWARYYQIETDRPVFGDRDKSIHDSVDDISEERRNHYRWYSGDPAPALDRFEIWNREHADSR
ncbi:MAG TPA: pectate lyase [Terracidiphilus sp.]|nr:pectate lyase [Terracidiphilus sp.]